MYDIPLASGCGQFHSDTDKKHPTPLNSITFNDILNLASNPPTVDKSAGQWVIPSTLHTRNFKDQADNGVYWCLWADIDEGSPDITRITVMLNTLTCEYLTYNSRSAIPDLFKWRIIIPLLSSLSGREWPRYQQVLNNVIRHHGMIPDTVNERTGQLCILPNRGQYYRHVHDITYGPLNPVGWESYLPPAAVVAPRAPGSGTDNPQFDKYLNIAMDAGMVLDDLGDGHYTVICPNHAQHTGGRNEARLTAPSPENQGQGGFSCLHDHCGHLNIGHLYNQVSLNPVVDATTVFTQEQPARPVGAIAEPPPGVQAARDALAEYVDEPESTPVDVDEITVLAAKCHTVKEAEPVLRDLARIVKDHPLVVDECLNRMKENGVATLRGLRQQLSVFIKDLKIQRMAGKQVRIATQGHELHKLFNHKYHIIDGGSKPVVVNFGRDAVGNACLVQSNFDDFLKRVASLPLQEDPRDKSKDYLIPAGSAWLNWEHANRHTRITFNPACTDRVIEYPDGSTDLNTYFPPALTPIRNDALIVRFLTHLQKYTCEDDSVQYDYLIRWIAHMFQKPWEKPGKGIVLQGEQGCGKTVIADTLGKILGSTYMKYEGSGSLSKRFNESQGGKILIFADEALEADSSILKSRITSSTVMIEPKHLPILTLPCYARVILGSNDNLPTRITEDDRRVMVAGCGKPPGDTDASIERREYWLPIEQEIGHPEFHNALYGYFLSVDISRWDPAVLPMTARKREMINSTRPPLEHWLFESVSNGVWFGSNITVKCGEEMPMSMLKESAAAWMKSSGAYFELNHTNLGRTLRKFGFHKSSRGRLLNGVSMGTCRRVPKDVFKKCKESV